MLTPAVLSQIVELMHKGIEEASIALYPAEHRKHLGASVVGRDCRAYIWNSFRWLHLEQHNGRMRRLFNRGHREEAAIIELLIKAGFDVKAADENGNQFKINGCNGHFGGSLDGMTKAPLKFIINDILVLEFKTHGQKSFDDLKKNKVKIAKPEHWAQMCAYGKPYNIKYALYIAVNKNDDDIYLELLELDYNYADEIYRRATSIIIAKEQPVKISPTKTFWKCKGCHFSPICHDGALPEKNCRSCVYAVPVANGNWNCANSAITLYTEHLEDELIAVGCNAWKPIINAS